MFRATMDSRGLYSYFFDFCRYAYVYPLQISAPFFETNNDSHEKSRTDSLFEGFVYVLTKCALDFGLSKEFFELRKFQHKRNLEYCGSYSKIGVINEIDFRVGIIILLLFDFIIFVMKTLV